MTRCEQAQADLDALLAARTAMATGRSVVRVKLGDKETQYSAPNVQLLANEIRRLQGIVNACNGCAGGMMVRTVNTDC